MSIKIALFLPSTKSNQSLWRERDGNRKIGRQKHNDTENIHKRTQRQTHTPLSFTNGTIQPMCWWMHAHTIHTDSLAARNAWCAKQTETKWFWLLPCFVDVCNENSEREYSSSRSLLHVHGWWCVFLKENTTHQNAIDGLLGRARVRFCQMNVRHTPHWKAFFFFVDAYSQLLTTYNLWVWRADWCDRENDTHCVDGCVCVRTAFEWSPLSAVRGVFVVQTLLLPLALLVFVLSQAATVAAAVVVVTVFFFIWALIALAVFPTMISRCVFPFFVFVACESEWAFVWLCVQWGGSIANVFVYYITVPEREAKCMRPERVNERASLFNGEAFSGT